MQEDGRDVAALARLITASRFGANSVHLICDGTPPSGHDGAHEFTASGARITYAGAGKEADALIEDLIKRSSAPTRMIVVSSDRRIQRAARRRRAVPLSSQRFLALVVSSRGSEGQEGSPRPEQISSDEIHHWLEEFGISGTIAGANSTVDKTEGDPANITESFPSLPEDLDQKDLDMSRWLDDIEPLPPADASNERFPDPPFGGSHRPA